MPICCGAKTKQIITPDQRRGGKAYVGFGLGGNRTKAPARHSSGQPQSCLQNVSMRTKFGSYYADWRDERGRRHMKAFKSKRAAAKYTAKMQAQAAAKKARASARSAQSRRRGPRPGRPESAPLRANSQPSAAA
jgi:hypothetical protein